MNKIKIGLAAIALAVISLATLAHAQSKDDIRITLTGDSNIHRRLSVFDDPAYLEFFKHIQTADASFTNLEAVIHPLNIPGAAFAGGTPGISPSWTVDELKWAGFNLLSVANNHSLDYGIDGLRANLHALDAAGLVHAGEGENLAFARAPAYLDTKKGRVALIAMASTLTLGEQASQQRPDLPGRPGVNPLRYNTTITVDQATVDTLRKVAALSVRGFGGEGAGTRDPNQVRFANAVYVAGDTTSVHTDPDKDDLDAAITSIINGHRQADWVIGSIHAHETKPGTNDQPADFVIALAHQAIDAGADIFVVHGPHNVRGIEIYKGKPIIYSLGNFVFDGEAGIPFAPSEVYDSHHLPWNSNISDYREATSKGDTIGYGADKENWDTALVEITFSQDHKLKELVLYPATLGYGLTRSQRGFPHPASPAAAKDIIGNIAKRSEPFGTKVEFINGHGVIKLDQK
ncbi:MAG: CapA family protein [Acidobacteriaceae bacterium]|nr:CapA family protein [Acidobacteriaceae bacterium]